MAILKINPTRMELKNLENRLQIAVRGHHLLKEKQDSMIQLFMGLQEDAKNLRRQVEHQFVSIHTAYRQASVLSDDRLIKKSLSQLDYKLSVKIRLDSIYSVAVPQYRVESQAPAQKEYSTLAISHHMDQISGQVDSMAQRLIDLAEIEKKCLLLASEIKTTRRRVNALEHRTIVDIRDTIKFIKMKIDEQERSQTARVMKIKD